jgi:hypothetical protein
MRAMMLPFVAMFLTVAPSVVTGADSPPIDQKTIDPLQLPFGVEPFARSLESSQRLREEFRHQDLRVDPDPNRRMFRPKQPEPGYSEVRPYSGTDVPTRVRPIRPAP